jgi:hypothetical protein
VEHPYRDASQEIAGDKDGTFLWSIPVGMIFKKLKSFFWIYREAYFKTLLY